MIATIELGKKKVKLLSNAVTALHYKQVFHKDLLVMMLVDAPAGKMNDAEAVEMAQEMCYIMACQAAKKEMSYEGYLEWLESQEQMDLIERSFDIIDVFKGQMPGLSESKKKEEQLSAD